MKCISCGADVRIGRTCEYCGTYAEDAYYQAVKLGEPVEKMAEVFKENPKLPCEYKVKRGDCLWTISRRFYGQGRMYQKIAKENKLKDPNKIYPGQVIKIP